MAPPPAPLTPFGTDIQALSFADIGRDVLVLVLGESGASEAHEDTAHKEENIRGTSYGYETIYRPTKEGFARSFFGSGAAAFRAPYQYRTMAAAYDPSTASRIAAGHYSGSNDVLFTSDGAAVIFDPRTRSGQIIRRALLEPQQMDGRMSLDERNALRARGAEDQKRFSSVSRVTNGVRIGVNLIAGGMILMDENGANPVELAILAFDTGTSLVFIVIQNTLVKSSDAIIHSNGHTQALGSQAGLGRGKPNRKALAKKTERARVGAEIQHQTEAQVHSQRAKGISVAANGLQVSAGLTKLIYELVKLQEGADGASVVAAVDGAADVSYGAAAIAYNIETWRESRDLALQAKTARSPKAQLALLRRSTDMASVNMRVVPDRIVLVMRASAVTMAGVALFDSAAVFSSSINEGERFHLWSKEVQEAYTKRQTRKKVDSAFGFFYAAALGASGWLCKSASGSAGTFLGGLGMVAIGGKTLNDSFDEELPEDQREMMRVNSGIGLGLAALSVISSKIAFPLMLGWIGGDLLVNKALPMMLGQSLGAAIYDLAESESDIEKKAAVAYEKGRVFVPTAASTLSPDISALGPSVTSMHSVN